MATISTPARSSTSEGDMRVVIRNVGWQGYQKMLDLIGDQPIRKAYDRGDLELMSPSQPHERYKNVLARMIEAITSELNIPCEAAGSTTWRKEEIDRGIEADECYYLAHATEVIGKDVDLEVDPPPDLAIEVDTSRSALDRAGIYAALGVPEVWRFDGQTLRIEQLEPDGKYHPRDHSPGLPFLSSTELTHWLLLAATMGQTTWHRQLLTWIRTDLSAGLSPDPP
ncbi:MAG TPA: Uma2 family endonuclease [Isosphaeraceae bacterium]|jgi:Uma2 family endonuclease|nr:Uma2 family endonuclease [Isosphaeraceae bacterium]